MSNMKTRFVVAGVIIGILILATGIAVVIVQPWKPGTTATAAPSSSPSESAPPKVVTGYTLNLAPSTVVVSPGVTKVGGGQLVLTSSNVSFVTVNNPTTARAKPADEALVTKQRVMCAANLKSIGQALLLYANENRGSYPSDFGELVRAEDIAAICFVCPAVGKTPPRLPPGGGAAAAAEIAAWVNANSDYRYISGFKSNMPSDLVVAFEKDTNEYGDGMNLLYGDGHVAFLPLADATSIIQRSLEAVAAVGGTLH